MTPVRFGVGFAPNVPAPQVIEAAQLAERLGFDVFWITDSHLAAREAMAMLGALAVSTERIHLGPGVSHLACRARAYWNWKPRSPRSALCSTARTYRGQRATLACAT